MPVLKNPRHERAPLKHRSVDIAAAAEILNYDPVTGVFTWKVRRGPSAPAGSIAGTAHPRGYLQVTVHQTKVLAHRLAWAMVHGEWPPHHVDHINGDPTDNRIANLRLATNAENSRNSKVYGTNSTGYKGVSYMPAYGKYRAYIVANYRQRHLGRFDTAEEAHAAYVRAAKQMHGEFSRLA